MIISFMTTIDETSIDDITPAVEVEAEPLVEPEPLVVDKVKNNCYVHIIPQKLGIENPCFWSSLVYTTNMLSAYITGQYLYSILFGYLTVSSLIIHSYYSFWTSIIDRFFATSIVLYGGYKMYLKAGEANNLLVGIAVSTFLYAVFVYIYGYYTNSYCFSSEYGYLYHSSLHVLSSIGHHAIIFL